MLPRRITNQTSKRLRVLVLAGSSSMLSVAGPAWAIDFSWASDSMGLAGSWSQASHWLPGGGPPSGANTATINAAPGSGYTVTLDINPTIAEFTLNSVDCTLDGTGRTMTASVFNLLNGTVVGTPTLSLQSTSTLNIGAGLIGGFNAVKGPGSLDYISSNNTLAPGRSIFLNSVGGAGGTSAMVGQAGLVNQGAIHLAGSARAAVRVAGTLVNEGLINTQAPVENYLQLQLDNTPSGTVMMTQDSYLGSGTSAFMHTNRGTMSIAAGKTLYLYGQQFEQMAGIMNVDGALSNRPQGNDAPANLLQTGGTMAFGPASTGIEIDGAQTVNFQAGTITGSPTLRFRTSGGTLQLSTDGSHTGNFNAVLSPTVAATLIADKLVPGRTLRLESQSNGNRAHLSIPAGFINQSTITLEGPAFNTILSTGTLVNEGLIQSSVVGGDDVYTFTLDNAPTGILNVNKGVRLGGGGQAPTRMHVNRGSINVAAGQTLYLYGGQFEQMAGVINVDGALSNRQQDDVTPVNLLQTGGTMAFGPASTGIEIDGAQTVNFQAGTITGSPTLRFRTSGGTLQLSTDGSHTGNFNAVLSPTVAVTVIADKLVPGRTLRLESQSNGNRAHLSIPAGFINQSSITLEGPAFNTILSPGTLVNEGLIQSSVVGNADVYTFTLDNAPTGILNLNKSVELGGRDPVSSRMHVNRGSINVAAGQTLYLYGQQFEQMAGVINVDGALSNDPLGNGAAPIALFLQSGGLVQLNSASVALTGVNVAGSTAVAFDGGLPNMNLNSTTMTCASMSIGGSGAATVSLSNASRLDTASQFVIGKFGTLALDGTSAVDVGSGTPSIAGAVRVSNGGLFVGAGSLTGSVNVGTGTFRLGDPLSSFNVSGSYSSIAQSTVEAELGGAVAGSGYDQLIVGGTALIDGQLSLAILNGYNPTYLQRHTLALTASLSGRFSQVNGSQISSAKILAVTYDSDEIFVTAALPGDSNLDGITNISDFAILASNFNETGTWVDGNFDQNGLVNISDFALLAANFNLAVPLTSPRTSVPEPAMLSLILAGICARHHRTKTLTVRT